MHHCLQLHQAPCGSVIFWGSNLREEFSDVQTYKYHKENLMNKKSVECHCSAHFSILRFVTAALFAAAFSEITSILSCTWLVPTRAATMTAVGRCCTAVNVMESGIYLDDIVATAGCANYNLLFVIRKICLTQKEISLHFFANFGEWHQVNTGV